MKILFRSLLLLAPIVFSCKPRVQSYNKASSEQGAASNSTTEIQKIMNIDGVWSLGGFGDSKIILKDLYPSKLPSLKINQSAKQISGNTGCNSFSGKIVIEGDIINLEEPMAMTQRFCAGEGESTFLGHLQRVKNFRLIDDSSLQLLSGDTLLMKFTKSTGVN